MTPAQLAQKGLRVKPLEWVLTKHVAPIQNGHRATGAGVSYTIISGRDDKQCLLSSHGAAYIGPSPHPHVITAKASAEADHAARIAAMIEETPHDQT